MAMDVRSRTQEVLLFAKDVVRQEIEGAKKLLDHIDDDFIQAIDWIVNCRGKVIVMGVGKTGIIGRKIAGSLASTGTPAFFIHGDESLHGDLGMIEKQDLILLLTNSGESRELCDNLPSLKKIGCKIISMTSNAHSVVAEGSDLHLCIGQQTEASHISEPPTTSATAALILGDALAMTAAYLKNFTSEQYAIFHPGGYLGQNLAGKAPYTP